ncbi:MAG: hypothetical protein AB7G88_06365, partial [Thermomicrobiales bacterium]
MSDATNKSSPPEPEMADPSPESLHPFPPEIKRRLIQIDRTMTIRIAIAIALVAISAVTNRGFLGWGLLFVMGVLVVPVGRARSCLIAIVPYAGVWFIFT